MNKLINFVLEYFGVKAQMRSDLGAIAGFVLSFVLQVEEQMGGGNGAAKKQKALDLMLDEIAKEGGIDLPSWLTGEVARSLFSAVIEWFFGNQGTATGNS